MPGLAKTGCRWTAGFPGLKLKGKDGLTVKKMFAMLIILGIVAFTLASGASGCKKEESKKADATPTKTS
jgi:hypothetical protein